MLAYNLEYEKRCQKITAYYNGTFKFPFTNSLKFYSQIQISLYISDDNKVHISIDKFKELYADGGYDIRLVNGYTEVL
jgi:hypothetical protein